MAERELVHSYHKDDGRAIGGLNCATIVNVTNGDNTEPLAVSHSEFIDVMLTGTVAGAVIEGTLDPNSDTSNWFPCTGASGASLTGLAATGLFAIAERPTYIRVRGANGSDNFAVRIAAHRR